MRQAFSKLSLISAIFLSLLLALCAPLAAQQINLQTQVKGLLPPANGGVGLDTSGTTGCPKLTSGTWSFSSANCSTGGSAAGGNYAIQYFNGGAFAGANFTGIVKNNGSSQPPTAALYSDIVPLWPSCTGALWSTGVCIDTTNASLIVSGTLADARLSANVPLLNATNLFTGQNTFGTSATTGIQINPGSGSGASINGLVGGFTTWTVNSTGLADFAGVISAGDIGVNSQQATSGSNKNSQNFYAEGQYFNGASAADTWTWNDVMGAGTNPTSTLTFSQTGATGGATVSFPATTVRATGTATSGNNFSSYPFCISGSVWTGVATADSWCWKVNPATGTNPSVTMTLTHTGTSGLYDFSVGANLEAQVITGTDIYATGTFRATSGVAGTYMTQANINMQDAASEHTFYLYSTTGQALFGRGSAFTQDQTIVEETGAFGYNTAGTGTWGLNNSTGNAFFAFTNVVGLDSSANIQTTAPAATSGANQNSPSYNAIATYFNGASSLDTWSWFNQIGTGPTPSSTLIFNHGGPGASNVQMPDLAVTGVSTLTTIQGPGVPTFAPGAAANVGTGATLVCAAAHHCDSNSGTMFLTTGTGTLSGGGTIATITTGITRPVAPNCTANITITSNAMTTGATTTQIFITSYAALVPSTSYFIVYVCMN